MQTDHGSPSKRRPQAGVLVTPLFAMKLPVEIDWVGWERCYDTRGFNRGKQAKSLMLWAAVMTFKAEGWIILLVVNQ